MTHLPHSISSCKVVGDENARDGFDVFVIECSHLIGSTLRESDPSWFHFLHLGCFQIFASWLARSIRAAQTRSSYRSVVRYLSTTSAITEDLALAQA